MTKDMWRDVRKCRIFEQLLPELWKPDEWPSFQRPLEHKAFIVTGDMWSEEVQDRQPHSQQLRRFRSEADIDSRRDLLGLSFARISPDNMFRKNRRVMRSPGLLAEYPATDRPEFGERHCA